MNLPALFWTTRGLCALELVATGREVGKVEAHLDICSLERGKKRIDAKSRTWKAYILYRCQTYLAGLFRM
jgi:hypothetical protein